MKRLACLRLAWLVVALFACSSAHAIVIISAVGFASCSPVPNDGCVAQLSYVTGDGSGGTIHTVNFNTGTTIDPFGIASYSGGATLNAGSPPSSDTTNFLTVNNATETITFSSPINYFGLYWGSIDGGNTVTIKNGANTLTTFTGASITSGDSYVSFNGTGGTTWDTVQISYGSCCFETDNHSYVLAATGTPEPSSGWMVVPAMLSLSAYIPYRRRKQSHA